MKAWIGVLLLGAASASASWAQSPAFQQSAPAVAVYPAPYMPDLPSVTSSLSRSGAQFPGASVPMPPIPIVAPPGVGGPDDNGKLNPIVDLNAPYAVPIELPPVRPFMQQPPLLPPPPVTGPRLWLDVDYMFWWIKRAPQPNPLVVTGSPNDLYPGAMDQPNTQVLYGGQGLGFNPFSGARVSMGLWCSPDNRFGVEVGGFILEQKANQFSANGGPTGSQFLARPFVDALTGADNVYFVSQNFADPTRSAMMTGGIQISSNSRLFGYELNGLYNSYRGENTSFSVLAGFTSVGLREKLDISESLQNLSPAGGVTYLGAPVSPATQELTFDKFDTMNTFYGSQLGARLHFEFGQLMVDLTGKAAIGVMQQLVDVQGLTAVEGPNGKLAAATPGGVYAVASNIGPHFQDRFGFVPEGNLNLSYALYNNLILKAGYTFIYMNSVARPGNQINQTVNPGLVPSDATYGTPGGPAQPGFQFHTTDFWAQGISLGVEVRY